jgi:hypothetical protein
MTAILTDGGIVTEVLPVEVDGTPGYAVHGDPDEGFYPAEFVRVINTGGGISEDTGGDAQDTR